MITAIFVNIKHDSSNILGMATWPGQQRGGRSCWAGWPAGRRGSEPAGRSGFVCTSLVAPLMIS